MRLEAKVGRKVQSSYWKEDALEKSLLSLALPQEDGTKYISNRRQLPGKERGAEQKPVVVGYTHILEYGLLFSQLYHAQRNILYWHYWVTRPTRVLSLQCLVSLILVGTCPDHLQPPKPGCFRAVLCAEVTPPPLLRSSDGVGRIQTWKLRNTARS